MKKAAAFLLACLAAAQLCACAADPAQPVVTSDVLVSQDSAVQTALEQSAGQDYAYYWEGEHLDEEIEYYAELYRQELEALRGGEDSLNNRQLTAYYESELENDCPSQREYLEEIAALDPPVSAQEAANIAGEYFEVLYGIDLSQQPIILRYIQGNDQWDAMFSPLLDEQGRVPTGVQSNAAFTALCYIRSDTGEIVGATYCTSQEENQAMTATELPAYIQRDATYTSQIVANYFDMEAPGAQEALEAMKEQLTTLLSGTVAVGGAQITSVTVEDVVYSDQPPRINDLYFHLTASNGRTYTLFWNLKYPNYDFGGFPLRAFSLSSDG